MRSRLIALVLIVFAVTAVGFFEARRDTAGAAQQDARHRAEIAATEVSGGMEQAANLVESLRRFMLGHAGPDVTNAQFVDIGGRWLSPAGLPAAAWMEHAPTPGARGAALRATLVTGANPMTAPGIVRNSVSALSSAVADPRALFQVAATPLTRIRDGRTGLFLVQSAPRLSGGALHPGFIVLFVPGSWLLAEVTEEQNPELLLRVGGTSYGDVGNATAVGSSFSAAGRRFEVLVPRKPVAGASGLLPWLILGAGAVLAALIGVLAALADRRARAQRQVDRIFEISPDALTVSGFDGLFKRVNPAFETLLGYTERELLGRRYTDFIHPDDRDRAEAEGTRVGKGATALGLELRMASKDGSYKWIDWTAIAVREEHLVYGVGRDVTERRRSESEETALRRVAMLVAQDVEPQELFAVVAEEIARVIEVPLVRVIRYESDGTATQCASYATTGPDPFPQYLSLEGTSVLQLVRETSEAARIDDYSGLEGEVAKFARDNGILAAAGTPIVVAGRIWGAVVASSYDQLPADTDARLTDLTGLLATAIASTESHESLKRLAAEQAGLRRVATLVARGAPPEEVFAVAVQEVGRLLPVQSAAMGRLEADGMCTTVAAWSAGEVAFPVGGRWVPEGKNITAMVFETGRPARLNDFSDASGQVGDRAREAGYRSAVGTPITVEGRLWGVMSAATTAEEPLPPDTERRLASFTELLATAIANAESRAGLAQLAEQQAALRRVAMLVAEEPSPDEVFNAVTEVVAPLLGADLAAMHVYPGDGTATTIAGWSAAGPMLPVGTRLPLDTDSVVARIFHTGAAARTDSYDNLEGDTADVARGLRLRSTVGAPIVVEGKLWGALMAATRGAEPLPEDAATRIAAFTELVATAVANAQAREDLQSLLDEQAALRRLAVLVAQGVPPAEIFSAVTHEVEGLFGAGGGDLRFEQSALATVNRLFEHDAGAFVVVGSSKTDVVPIGSRSELHEGPSAEVYRTGRSSRLDAMDWASAGGPVAETVDRPGATSTVASPIVVDGRLWGAMSLSSTAEPLPVGAEERLEKFTELVATAIANAESSETRRKLSEQEAALRRVATLVAEGVEPAELFTVMAEGIALVCDVPATSVVRYESDGTASELANFLLGSPKGLFPVGVRMNIEGDNILRLVRDSGAAARIDDYSKVHGEMAETVRRSGITSTVGVPIIVGGRVWGTMAGSTTEADPLPEDTAARMTDFTELLATAIENSESHEALERLAEEQAALRRVATLVAEGVPHAEVFASVAREVAHVLRAPMVTIDRYEPDASSTVVASLDDDPAFPVGSRWPLDGPSIGATVLATASPARIDDYADLQSTSAASMRESAMRSAVGAPILVDGRPWGVICVGTGDREPLPKDTEARLADFTELIAAAIARSESRAALARVADEQAALRRMATLVAQGVRPAEIFSAVSDEVCGLFASEAAAVIRFDHDAPALVLVGVPKRVEDQMPIGTRWDIDDSLASAKVYRTGRSARSDAAAWSSVGGSARAAVDLLGITSTVASPIIVEGRLWGATSVSGKQELPSDTEERLENFSDLVATAIANAYSKSELAASRRRIVAAADDTRRRIERDLHDGTQQRLVSLELGLRAAEAEIPPDSAELRAELARVASGLSDAVEELREISRGIHPAILSQGGLGPALRTLARRSRVPVDLNAHVDRRLPERVEVGAYYIASEALTNVAKHAHASVVRVDLGHEDGVLRLSIRDDGIGGVDPGRGSGLIGLQDRVEALGGTITIDSTPGNGTSLVVTLPLDDEAAGAGK